MKARSFIVALLFIPLIHYGQPGSLDLTFANNGIFIYDLGISNFGWTTGLVIQDDQKIIWSGARDLYDPAIMRLLPNGSIDSAFGTDGSPFCHINQAQLGFSYPSAAGHSISIQEDGKIVVCGKSVNADKPAIERFKTDGTPDDSFGNNGTTNTSAPQAGIAYSTLIHNQKIIIAGQGNENKMIAIRWDNEANLDLSFNGTGKVSIGFDSLQYTYAYAYAAAIDSNDKIILTGLAYVQGTMYGSMVRLNWDGSFDTSFSDDGSVLVETPNSGCYLFDAAVQADGKIVAVGHVNGFMFDRHLIAIRLNANGTLDSTFAVNGIFEYPVLETFANAVVIQPDQKIVIAGNGSPPAPADVMVMRLNVTGLPDSSFGINGVVSTHVGIEDYVSTIALQQDGKLVVAGYSEDPFGQDTIFLIRYDLQVATGFGSGNSDPTFLLFPNPVQSLLNIDLRNFYKGLQIIREVNELIITVYDVHGRKANLPVAIENHQVQINTASLTKGIYLLQLAENKTGRTATAKFVKGE